MDTRVDAQMKKLGKPKSVASVSLASNLNFTKLSETVFC